MSKKLTMADVARLTASTSQWEGSVENGVFTLKMPEKCADDLVDIMEKITAELEAIQQRQVQQSRGSQKEGLLSWLFGW